MFSRRDFIKILLSSAVAEAMDVEKLLWTPKPIVTVPALPSSFYGVPYHASTHLADAMRMYFDNEKLRHLFERDSKFYEILEWDKTENGH